MLTLRSKARITKIKKKSSMACFSDLAVGDIIEFSLPVTRVGYYSGSSIPKTVKVLCHNCRTDKESYVGINRLVKGMECCCIKEIFS